MEANKPPSSAAQVRAAQMRAARQRYNATPKGQAAKAKGRAKYRASPKRHEDRVKYRAKYRSDRKSRRRFSRKLKVQERHAAPFVGCDGEGTTTVNPDGSRGTHRYTVFRMGERELYRDGARLTTPEILAFILEHPRKTDLLVGFAFEYDVTSILVDLPVEQRVHLLATYQQLTPVAVAEGALSREDGRERPVAKPAPRPPGFAKRWTWATFDGYGTFGLNWLSRNHLAVCRPHPLGSADPRYSNASDRKTIRTIYDTFGFFQKRFTDALIAWEVGGAEVERIKAMKDARGSFETITPEIRAYNASECDLLAQVMAKFRTVCRECGIEPKTWNGAGKIASFLHNAHDTLRKSDLGKHLKIGVIRAAHAAYYGGRFEITRAGFICEPVHERDINSAYPAMMRKLPCLVHGEWTHVSGEVLRDLKDDAIFVCPIRYSHPPGQFLCGLPYRSKFDGRLSWRREGRGVYWSPEIRSAERLGASCAYGAGWLYERRCKCKPFDWVETLYRQRKALGALKGQPLKLGLNSLYGKLAQRIGDPQFANPVWAGLITAMTRAVLNDAIRASNPERVVMIATDAIYTLGKPPGLKIGDALGEWSAKTWPGMFIVQPGLYWGTLGVKSRGISASTIGEFTGQFEEAWSRFSVSDVDPFAKRVVQLKLLVDRNIDDAYNAYGDFLTQLDFPSVNVTFPAFIGMRLAGHWGKPGLAGQWIDQERNLSFSWTGKRDYHKWLEDRSAAILYPIKGDLQAVSAHYEEGGGLSTAEGWEVERMLFEAMPWAEPLFDAETEAG
jgi:hypothetical protein